MHQTDTTLPTKPQIGVLGLGHRTTHYYLQQLKQKYRAHFGAERTCPLLLIQSDFEAMNAYLPNQYFALEPMLQSYLDAFSKQPLSQLILPNITLHETLDRLVLNQWRDPKIVHPINITLQRLQERNIKETAIFSSLYGMNSSVLATQFKNAGIDLIKPSLHDQQLIDDFRNLVYLGKETSEDRKVFHSFIHTYQAQSPIVIACTELSIFTKKTRPHNTYDMVEIQLEKTITEFIQQYPNG